MTFFGNTIALFAVFLKAVKRVSLKVTLSNGGAIINVRKLLFNKVNQGNVAQGFLNWFPKFGLAWFENSQILPIKH